MQLLLVGLVARLLQQRSELRLVVADGLNQLGFAGGAETPDQRAQRVDLGIGLVEQAFDFHLIVDAGEHGRVEAVLERAVPLTRDGVALLDFQQRRLLRLCKVFDTGRVGIHQGLDLLQAFPGVLALSADQRLVEGLLLGRLEALHVGNVPVDFLGCLGEANGPLRKLDHPEVEHRGRDAVDDALGPGGALVGGRDLRFGHHLIGHQARREQHADGPGQAELVADTIELDHSQNPDPKRVIGGPCIC
ncbi:hypothetical protein ES707_02154 [subsurface metagenome]